ncbi:hypothetical protein HNR26_000730 [Rhizobium rosettiformans]|uniref:Class I SAM-dependent methyltransferase n=2 Tax=Rhizobium rosettiformans TaxID=1368430 RepID=A0A4S8PUK1_9HYPH|nr:hypothetical protein [Rhizobium rosettiformans]MBB5274692.1 hypothetical protein [Rhizobium rosettiformans]THV34081.1 hypothetical protein FAA86_16640 [Rhizobium rosettiformans W3]
MILEALNYAASWPVTSAAHRPFIRSSVNLWARANRCRADWADHERRTMATILSAAEACRQRRTVVVLGSGLLRDVPVAELSRLFDTVVLVDLVHLASVRSWLTVKRFKNIRLIERDLSGLDALLAGEAVEPLSFLRQVPYLDFVVSANLLSQIGVGAARKLEGHVDAEVLVPQVIAAHLEGLAQVPAATCLVTDVGYTVIDRNNQTHETVDLMHGVDPGPVRDSWDWPVIPFGEESRDYKIVHRVIVR